MNGTEKPRRLGWGIIGAGSYVSRVATMPAILASPFAHLVSVSTSDPAKFAEIDGHHFKVHSDPSAILQDPLIDAVYLPLPNHLHQEWILKCIDAGKDVLCEKPLEADLSNAERLFDRAEESGRILAEAYMTHYHPRHRAALARVRSGVGGRVQMMTSSFTGTLRQSSENYRWRGSLGGGSLEDVGIYALAPIWELFGERPDSIEMSSLMEDRSGKGDPTDTYMAATLTYLDPSRNGEPRTAHLQISFVSGERQNLCIISENEVIEISRACTPTNIDDRFIITNSEGEELSEVTEAKDPYLAMIDEVSKAMLERVEPSWDRHSSMAISKLKSTVRGHLSGAKAE